MKTKRFIQILTVLFFVATATAQQGINYKAIIHDNIGVPMANSSITVQFTILENGTFNVYQETHAPTTDANGIIILNIGKGTPVSGDFSAIDWGSNPHFLKTEVDIGEGLTDMGIVEFMAVPYALYADKAGNESLIPGNRLGDMLYWNGTDWHRIPVKYSGYVLTLVNGIPTWVGDSVTVTTNEVTAIETNSATSGGNITAYIGVPYITERGICWNTSRNPTINDSRTIDGEGQSAFTSLMTELSSNTKYYIRAYAINSVVTDYGNEVWFATKGETGSVTDIDGNVYSTIVIGAQEWMAEDLKVTHFADGTAIPYVESNEDWAALEYTDKAYCVYTSDLLFQYNWAAAMNGEASSNTNPSGVQGVCPDGWHLPSDAEWIQLEIYLGIPWWKTESSEPRGTDEGGKLKAVSNDWRSPNEGATNSTGFTALPAGNRMSDGTHWGSNQFVIYWTSVGEYTSGGARALHYDDSLIRRSGATKDYGVSVRCVKD